MSHKQDKRITLRLSSSLQARVETVQQELARTSPNGIRGVSLSDAVRYLLEEALEQRGTGYVPISMTTPVVTPALRKATPVPRPVVRPVPRVESAQDMFDWD